MTPQALPANDKVLESSAVVARSLEPNRAHPDNEPPSYSAVPSINLDDEFPPHPPRYSIHLPGQHARLAARGSGASQSTRTMHEFHLKGGKGGGNKDKAWATLGVFSQTNGISGRQKFPRFFGGDTVAGKVDLDFDMAQAVQSITLSLRGRVITSSLDDGSYGFLDQPITIWNRHMSDPHLGATARALYAGSSDQKYAGKLVGKYSWPFSFAFPQEVVLPGHTEPCPLPQTFIERGINANLQYDLVLHINNGFLRPNSKLQITVVYTPSLQPDPPSLLRQHAYANGVLIPCPGEDPSGWISVPKILISGNLFRRPVGLECTLFLANPQCYTRGTVIPCYITIYSEDKLALDLLASSKSINVKLSRTVTFQQDATQAVVQHMSGAVGRKAKSSKPIDIVEECGKAVWWVPPTEPLQESDPIHRFSGEIHLPANLQPTCAFSAFAVSYRVELHAFDSAVFECTNSKSGILGSYDVEIATRHSEGPIPVPFSNPPPGRASKARETQELEIIEGNPQAFKY